MIYNGFLRSLVSGVRRVYLGSDGITIIASTGASRTHQYASLLDAISVRSGIFGASLCVGEMSLIVRMHREDVEHLAKAYEAGRLAYWQARAVTALKQIEAGIAEFRCFAGRGRYLRTSELHEAEPRLRTFHSALLVLPECAALGLPVPEGTEELSAFFDDPEGWRGRFNKKWMGEQEDRFGPYFDSLEKHPLTPSQRRACMVDEDNVLVLAGAGTGKTSTMMAKAAYLVRSGLAKPDEILMLAFANKARQELEDRVHAIEGMEAVRVEPFHSLGSKIIGAAEGARMAVSAMAQDEKLRTKFIDDGVAALQEKEDFMAHLREFFRSYLVPVPNDLSFKNFAEYVHYYKNFDIRSLKGDVVKSRAELEIANYLFLNGIEYVYEGHYEHPTATASRTQYRPDFYLPDLQVYVEHFGIDRKGGTAPHINRDDYWDGIRWKRETHSKYGTALIETYGYEDSEGTLLDVLKERLIAHCDAKEIDFPAFSREKPFDALKELGSYKVFAKLLDGFLNVFKGSPWTLNALRGQLGSSWEDMRLRVFLRIFEAVLARYEAALAETRTIDFNDMIRKSTAYVESGKFKSPYRYIMVDEFQDISPARATLVKALRNQVPGCALFCVGDDWQAIYRFTGSDVTLTTQFRENFGATERVDLDKTFRFNNRLSAVASQFVQVNPGQLRKNLRTHAQSAQTEVAIIREPSRAVALGQALDAVAARVGDNRASVYLLGRYKDSKPEEMGAWQRRYPNLKLTFLTAHGSKGLEADYVVILDVIEGKKGFPSLMATDPIIERILPHAESFEHAEERRLFYVALTRARHSVWLLTRPGRESPFIRELIEDGYDVSFDREALTAEAIAMTHCPACGVGILERRSGRKGDFYGCSNFPYCDSSAASCPRCDGAPLINNGQRHRCANPDCAFEAKTCPACGVGYLKLNRGPYGAFWGCSNYRGDGPASCRYKEKVKAGVTQGDTVHKSKQL